MSGGAKGRFPKTMVAEIAFRLRREVIDVRIEFGSGTCDAVSITRVAPLLSEPERKLQLS